jgi:hypothetical protein
MIYDEDDLMEEPDLMQDDGLEGEVEFDETRIETVDSVDTFGERVGSDESELLTEDETKEQPVP